MRTSLAFVLLLAVPNGVLAQTDPQPDEARALFEAGRTAVEAGRYADAVVQLERSLELLPRLSTAYNLAVALRGTGDFIGARDNHQQLLTGTYGSLDPEARVRSEQLLAEAEAEIATLRIAVRGGFPARVTIDGHEVGRLEATGHLVVEVNPGTRRVGVEAQDRDPIERDVEVAAGTTEELALELSARIDERPGRIEFVSTDPNARVEVIGEVTGIGRLSAELPAGNYWVRITGEHGPQESRVAIPAGRSIMLELSPAEANDNAWIWVIVSSVAAVVLGAGAWLGWELYEPAPNASPDWVVVEL